jgi:peptidoglycan/xylan/chitin deacetylase (PgdA/CDA1 family)
LNYSIPILLYHRIEDSSLSTAIAPKVFRQQLEFLAEQGWTSLSADEFSFVMNSGRAMPVRSFLITFDDGYESIAGPALDVLKEFDFKAIAFLSTRFISGAQYDPALSADDDSMKGFLSWDQVRALQSSGVVDCQSHSHSHRNFTDCSLAEISYDLETSTEILTHELVLPRAHFNHLAWPWGASTPEWREVAAAAGFKYQYTVARQSFRLGSPAQEIPRSCFDATSFAQFQRQIWLQSGQFSQLWDLAYPFGRKLRKLPGLIRQTF